jgi:hypothetical protein
MSTLETHSKTASAAVNAVVQVGDSSALAPPSASRHFDAMNVWFPADYSSTIGNRPGVTFERSQDRRDALNWRLNMRDVTLSPRLWPQTFVVESDPAVSDSLNGNSPSSGNKETPLEFEIDEVFANLDQLFVDV